MKRLAKWVAIGLILIAAAALPTSRVAAQSAAVTDANLDEMITNAKTPADHDAIAAYYEQEAADSKKKADLHRNSADTYRKLKISKPVGMAEMCDNIAAMWDKISSDAERLAKMHHKMAKKAGPPTAQ